MSAVYLQVSLFTSRGTEATTVGMNSVSILRQHESLHKLIYLSVVVVLLLTLVPWPGPLEPRPACARDKAALVRKLVNKRWLPVLDKYGVTLPLECPLHAARDVFAQQEAAKVHVPPQWTCGLCGKAFYHEAHLDRHLDNRHEDYLNNGEDVVCLADFCDVMRCEVLLERMRDFDDTPPSATALDLWHQPLLLSSPSMHQSQAHPDQAVERALPRSLIRSSHSSQPWYQWTRQSRLRHHDPPRPPPASPPQPILAPDLSGEHEGEERREVVEQGEHGSCEGDEGDCHTTSEDTNNTDCLAPVPRPPDESGHVTGGPRELPLHPLHSWRDTCNEEHLAELRVKCQQLIQQCIGGLLLNLTLEQFKEVEGALSRAVCWYLTCDRYWEAGTMEPPEFPWGLVTGLVLLLTLGISLAYYIVWVLCESQDSYSTSKAEHGFEKRSQDGGGSTPGSVHEAGDIPPLRSTKLRHSAATESESECRDSGFNEGPPYPDAGDTHVYTDYDGQSYRSRHYSEDSRLSYAPEDYPHGHKYYISEERMFNYATTFMPNYEQRRLRRNRYNYLDDYDNYQDFPESDKYYDTSSLSREHSDSFIYVSYPPDVKKRFNENR
ncbi:uncharacterized protein LOC135102656 isoform X2 [Scylla paramamosain]|uniref:uncharacterized protein LOC135102656 isoform X2 n=1 Tax=Scylla paramamosain TaxID=85552 RepID=UPI00308289EB